MIDVSAIIDSGIHFGGDTRASISTQGGGAAANVATWLAHLNQRVYLVSRLGDDNNGRILHEEMDEYCVEHSSNLAFGERTGVVIILVDEKGERTMFPDSGANSGLSAADLPPLEGFTAAFLSGYALINPKSRKNVRELINHLKAAHIPLVFDPGTVGALRSVPFGLIAEWISLADVLILNEEEALFISETGNIESALIKLAAITSLVVVKRGAHGAMAIFEKALIAEVPGITVDVRDTTGAGDSFAAGFMAEWFTSKNLQKAMEYGASQAQLCILSVGARPPRVHQERK